MERILFVLELAESTFDTGALDGIWKVGLELFEGLRLFVVSTEFSKGGGSSYGGFLGQRTLAGSF